MASGHKGTRIDPLPIGSQARTTAGEKRLSPGQYDLMVMLCQLLKPVIHGHDAELVVSDWSQLLKLADQHLVTPALAWALADLQEVPAGVRDYLDGVAYLAVARAATALDELALVVGLLNEVGSYRCSSKARQLMPARFTRNRACGSCSTSISWSRKHT